MAPRLSPSDEPVWRRYLRFWKRDLRADVDEELRFHFESAVNEYRAAGMSAERADAEARRRFGNVSTVRQDLYSISQHREHRMQRAEWIDALTQDTRIAVRRLRSSPGFSAVVVLTLALGIGANSAIFSVVNAVMLRALPYRNGERLVNLREGNGPGVPMGMVVTYGNYATWVERSRAFEGFAGYTGGAGLTLTGSGDPKQLRLTRAAGSFFKVLYIPPVLGRYFDAEDARAGSDRVIVLSHRLWQGTFNADSSILGRTIALNGDAYVVRGVASPHYELTPQAADGWVPLVFTPRMIADHSDHELSVVGLVKEGITTEQALDELGGIQRALHEEYPAASFDGTIVARSQLDWLVGRSTTLLRLIFGAAALVLLIASVNIANLMLVRALGRRREMAVRGALGAQRRRIVAQLLVESLVLAGGGAVVGLVVAALGTRFLVRNGPQSLPRLHEASLDLTVVSFTLLLALVTGLVCGMLPALRASRLDLHAVFRDGARTAESAVRHHVRSALVIVQVAVALMLLTGAGLLVRSAMRLQDVRPGFDPANLLVASLDLPTNRYATDADVQLGYDRILGSAAALPGVESAALINRIPIGAFGHDCSVQRAGANDNGASRWGADYRVASPGYFATMRIPLVAGRPFAPGDRSGAPAVAIINERLARGLFGTERAIGRRIGGCGPFEGSVEVVGITGDQRSNGLASDVRDQVFYSNAQVASRDMYLVTRGRVPVLTLVPALRSALVTIDPQLPLSRAQEMQGIIDDSLATARFQSLLLSMLGACGLLLAILGVYGVVSYLVTQRSGEIGVRMALGSGRTRMLLMVLRQGVGLAIGGVALGTLASLATVHVLEGLLFGIAPRDPATFIGSATLLGAVVLAACALPAHRATRVDPIVALRNQ